MRFGSKTEDDYSLQLTSLIDVVFLLLIFFMVSTSFVDFTRRMDILLPQSKTSTEVERVENFLLEVGVEKKLSLNGKEITIDELEEVLDRGATIDGSSIAGFARSDESDMIAMPDPTTWQLLPWRPRENAVARMFCDILTPDGTPFDGDPRNVLRRNIQRASDKG